MEIFSLAFLLGVWSEETHLYSSISAIFALVVSLLCGVCMVFVKGEERKGWRPVRGATLFFPFIFFGVIRGQFIEPVSFEKKEEKPFQMMIMRHDIEEKSIVYDGKVDTGDMVRVRVSPQYAYSIGELVTVSPPWKENLFFISEDKMTLAKKDMFLTKFGLSHELAFPLTKKAELAHVKEDMLTSFSLFLTKKRDEVVSSLQKALPLREADLAAGVMFGDRYLMKEEKELFRNAGVSHIVALSGFNISVVIGLLLLFARFLPFFIRTLFVTAFVVVYVMMVDMSGSLLRASLMVVIAGVVFLFGARSDEKKVLFLSLFLLSMFVPVSVLHDVSLHLSYGALIGVLYVYPLCFEKFVALYAGYKKALLALFFESLSVSFILVPYAMTLFHTASIASVLATSIVTPVVPIVTILAILFSLSSLVGTTFSSLISMPLFILCSFIYKVAEVFSALPFLTFHTSLSTSLLIFYYACLTLFLLYRYQKNKKAEEGDEVKIVPEKQEIIEGDIYY